MQIGGSSIGVKFLKLNPYWLLTGVFAFGGTLCGLLANVADGDDILIIVGFFVAGIFILALWYTFYTARHARYCAARKKEFPDQRWKWKRAWQGQPFEAATRDVMITLWFFSLLILAISASGGWIITSSPHARGVPLGIYALATVGFALMAGACYQTVRWNKFGRTRFVPSSMPGVIGGYLGGVIDVPARMSTADEAWLALKCVRRETSGVGRYQSTTDNVLWKYEERSSRLKWITGPGGTQIPVMIYIPVGCSETDDRDLKNEVVWRLSAKAEVPGVDFSAEFEVPVFVTGEIARPPATD